MYLWQLYISLKSIDVIGRVLFGNGDDSSRYQQAHDSQIPPKRRTLHVFCRGDRPQKKAQTQASQSGKMCITVPERAAFVRVHYKQHHDLLSKLLAITPPQILGHQQQHEYSIIYNLCIHHVNNYWTLRIELQLLINIYSTRFLMYIVRLF